ncbi:MAG: hypothetical protein IJ575_07105 [Selenomonadaceae bacterium]|nr:hypothetical protein [Selenomonadaceae bacterium]
MTMTLNNSASMVALGNLNKNVKKVGATLAKIASGDRIPTAKYDSAGLAMSEILREQLRSLHQDQQNVQNGSAMFKTASGGIDDIIQNIRRLKELAINSANDSNSDIERATIQKEVDASLATIEDIAVGTEYNGIKLLDGTFGKSKSANNIFDTRSEPIGTPSIVTGSMTISSDGVYQLDESLGTATITVTASNVKIIGASSAKDVSIVMQNSSSLWLEDFKSSSGDDKNMIDFQGSNNFLHLRGTNSIDCDAGRNTSSAVIHAGGNLTISGEENSGTNGSLKITMHEFTYGAMIGSNNGETDNQSNITILSGTFDLASPQIGASIGASRSGSIGDITIYDGSFNLGSGQGSSAIGNNHGISNSITVYGGDITANRWASWGGDANVVGGNVSSIQFPGGKIHLQNANGGTAVDPNYNLPGTFSEGNRIYDQDLPNIPIGGGIDFNPLAIHHGTKSNQMDLFYINSMRPKSLGLESLDVTTQLKAEDAIATIESALEYALDVATDVGSYMARLEHTESNLEVKSENTALSDSVLRGADMAKEMTEYTKFNVLTQSAQAMLAQAGQNQSQVLSLLQ